MGLYPTLEAPGSSDGLTTLVDPPLRSELPREQGDAIQGLRITVHVVDAATDRGVPDAVVELVGNGEIQIGTAVANEAGEARFKLVGFLSGSFIVRATSKFLAGQVEYSTEAVNTAEPVDLIIYLHTRTTKNFQLLSYHGSPYSNVEVFSPFSDNVFRQNAIVPVIPLSTPIARSDTEGKFQIVDATGKGTLHFRFPSGTRGLAMVDFNSIDDCVISFPECRAVKVIVSGELGALISDASVRYLSSEINNGSRAFVRFWGREGMTDALGEFLLGEVEVGPYGRMRLIVEKPGYDAWEGELGESTVLNVELHRSRSVSVTVTKENGAVIQDATALIWTARFAEGAWAQTMPSSTPESWMTRVSNSEGRLFFHVHSLLPRAALIIQAEGFATEVFWPVEFPQPGCIQSLALAVEAPTQIRLVGDSKHRDTLYRLTVRDQMPLLHSNGTTFTSNPTLVSDVLPAHTVTIRPNEVLDLRQLRVGTYNYRLEAVLDAEENREGEFLAGTGLIQIPVPAGKNASHHLTGVVTSATHSLPLPGPRVVLKEAAPGTKSWTTVTDGSGLWQLPGITPGIYFVTWHADGYGLKRRLVNLNAEENSQSLDISLEDTFIVKVYFKSKRGMLHDNTYLFPYLANGDHCMQHSGIGDNLVRSADAIIDEHGCAVLHLPREDVYLDLFIDPEKVIATVTISAAEVAIGEAHIALP
jgi:hypothetical protein